MAAKTAAKIGVEFAITAARSLGNEVGKAVFKDKRTAKGPSDIEKTKMAIDLATKEYSLNTVDDNLVYIAKYTKKLIPIALETLAAYYILPTVAAATAFAAAGATVSVAVYTYSNIAVLAYGAKSACDTILDTAQSKQVLKSEEAITIDVIQPPDLSSKMAEMR